MRIFLTGGTGVVGSRFVRRLGHLHSIVGLARSDSAARSLRSAHVEVVRGSLADVTPAMLTGVDAVVHCAGLVADWATPEEFRLHNVDGTAALLTAAQLAGVRRFVHISAGAAVFSGEPMLDVDEEVPYPEPNPFRFGQSKMEAEKLVRAASRPGFTTVCLRPRLVWGSRDRTFLPLLSWTHASGLWFWPSGGAALFGTTHVDNVVEGIRCALVRGQSGGVYFLADDQPRTVKGFLEPYLASHSVTVPDRSIPDWLARPLVAAVEAVWLFLGRTSPPPVTRYSLRLLTVPYTVSTARARSELGWTPVTTIDQGFEGLRSVQVVDSVPRMASR